MGSAEEQIRKRVIVAPLHTRFEYMSRPDGLIGAAVERPCLALTPPSPSGRGELGRDEGGVVIALGDRRQISDHFSPMFAPIIAAPHLTSGRRREE
jgi:hypothetical protein